MSLPSFAPLLQGTAERAFRPLGTSAEVPVELASPVAPVEPVAEPGEAVREALVKSLQELATFRARLRGRYERELLELALGVARKVVQQELAERPEIWLGMIRDPVR